MLTKIRRLEKKPQLIGLSAVLDNLNGLEKWLDAAAVRSEHRPKELREGIYIPDGGFRFREYNSKKQGDETFVKSKGSKDDMLETITAHLVDKGEQLVIFTADRDSTVKLARAVAGSIKAKP